MSKNIASESEISAVNLIVGWNWFAFLMSFKTSSLVVVQNDAISSIKRFHPIGFISLFYKILVSISPMNMFAKATASFVPIAQPDSCKYDLFVNLNEFSLRMRRNISFKKSVGTGELYR